MGYAYKRPSKNGKTRYTALVRHRPGVLPALLRLLPAAAGYLREGSLPDIAVQRELPAEFRRATRWGMLTGPAAYIRSARRQARVAAEAQQEAPR